MKRKRFKRSVSTHIKTVHGEFEMICYPNENEGGRYFPNFALVYGEISEGASVPTRIQSECLTGHIFQSLSCDCYGQLEDALKHVCKAKRGVIIYLRQEGRGIGLEAKLKSYILQKNGLDTVDANLRLGHAIDPRDYEVAAEILKDLRIRRVELISNNPKKATALEKYGIKVVKRIALPPRVTPQNRRYLETKRDKMGHTFHI